MNSKDYLLLITRLSRKVITKISLEDWITFTLTTTAHKDGFLMSWMSSSATSWWDVTRSRKLSQKVSSSDSINASWRRFRCASPKIDSSMSMLSLTKIPLKELAVYYLPYNLQYAPSSLSFWSSVSASDTCTSMSKNWRTSGDYSLISLLRNLTKRNRTYLKFSAFCCSLAVFWLHIFEFPRLHISLWSLEIYEQCTNIFIGWGHYKLPGW